MLLVTTILLHEGLLHEGLLQGLLHEGILPHEGLLHEGMLGQKYHSNTPSWRPSSKGTYILHLEQVLVSENQYTCIEMAHGQQVIRSADARRGRQSAA